MVTPVALPIFRLLCRAKPVTDQSSLSLPLINHPRSRFNARSLLCKAVESTIRRPAVPPPPLKFPCSAFGRPKTSVVVENSWASTCSYLILRLTFQLLMIVV
ncbi:PREDICTED: uncharacterized protein LOC106306751 isoform X1 [Brassica oleracea var. oleracea]|nr:PREDICTED: uncharacterized protein LOC106306751 isoform X1 [Brassica oleracea var. oleracea]